MWNWNRYYILPIAYFMIIWWIYISLTKLLFLHTGICNSKYNTSLGQVNTNLIWQQGGPYLNYTNGKLCDNGLRHYTVIGFFCGPEGSSNQPLLMEEYPCQTVIHWNIDLACEKRVSISMCCIIFLFCFFT